MAGGGFHRLIFDYSPVNSTGFAERQGGKEHTATCGDETEPTNKRRNAATLVERQKYAISSTNFRQVIIL